MNLKKNKVFCELLHKTGGRLPLEGYYKVYLGKRQGQPIWIVDGEKVARFVYPAFVMGGNDQRYRFNPPHDIWIDNRIGVEELEYTIAHELIERKFMAEQGLSYNNAHQHGLDLELKMRLSDERKANKRGKDMTDEIAQVYRMPFKKIGKLRVWIVDGPLVRKTLHPDFCFSTHDLMNEYIPENEIWLDSAMSSEHTYFALYHALEERRQMEKGMKASSAYEIALEKRIQEQVRQEKLVLRHEASLEPVSWGVRERGVKVERPRRRKS